MLDTSDDSTTPVLINGTRIWGIIDTGATSSCIKRSLAEQLDLPIAGNGQQRVKLA